MFTLRCTTCNARLGVKDETLIGQILACPKCGSMVHVVPPDDLQSGELRPVVAEFADPEEPEYRLNESEPPPIPPPLPDFGPSEAELRLRKILLGVLAGFVLFLVIAVGILFVRRTEQQPTVADPVVAVPEEPALLVPALEPETPEPQIPAQEEKEEISEPPAPEYRLNGEEMEEPTEPTEPTEPAEPEYRLNGGEIRTTTDLLADLERKLPGLVEPSAALMVDIPARLQLPLVAFKLDKTPLVAALRTLSRLTEVPITLDVDEFRCREIDFNAPVSEVYEPGTVGETLIALLAPFGLEPVIEDRQILVTVPQEERDKLIEKTFDIADLVNSDENLPSERLAEIVRRLVDPVAFSAEEPTIEQPLLAVDGTTLIVRHRLRMLDETLRLLEQLRVLRKLPQTTNIKGERLAPEVLCWEDAVQSPLTLNYYLPVSLAEVFPQLEAAAKIGILVDHKALNRALSPFSSLKGTVGSDGGTVDVALEKLLASVDGVTLTYRIVNIDTIEVTTREAAARPEKMSTEIHRYLLDNDETPEELVQTIRTALEHNTWNNPGNSETLGFGDIIIDKPSGCLIVRQSQSVQRMLRRWFETKTEQRVGDGTVTPQ